MLTLELCLDPVVLLKVKGIADKVRIYDESNFVLEDKLLGILLKDTLMEIGFCFENRSIYNNFFIGNDSFCIETKDNDLIISKVGYIHKIGNFISENEQCTLDVVELVSSYSLGKISKITFFENLSNLDGISEKLKLQIKNLFN